MGMPAVKPANIYRIVTAILDGTVQLEVPGSGPPGLLFSRIVCG